MVVVAVATPVGMAQALFTASATTTVGVTVATPIAPRPNTVSCANERFGALNLFVRARFTWTAPPGTAVAPTEYVIRANNGAGTVTDLVRLPGTTTSFLFQSDLLSGTLATVLNLLLAGGAQPQITVDAVFGVYESSSSYTYKLRSAVLGLTGIECLPV